MCLDVFSAVGFRHQMRFRYLRCRLEVKIYGVIHGLEGIGGDHFGNPWGVKIDESAEDTVVLLTQHSCVSFRLSNQLGILISALKPSMLQLSVFDSLWDSLTMVWWNLQVSNNRKVIRNKIRS